MKRILVGLAVWGVLGVAHGQIVAPVQLIVQPQTKKRGAGGGWYWSNSNDSRTLHIIVKNLSAQPISELTVRWGIVKTRIGGSTRGPRQAAYGDEQKLDLKPTEQKEFDTPSLDVYHHDWVDTGTVHGEKITGHGAQVLIGGKVVAEQFVPPGVKPLFEKLRPMPKDEEEPRPSTRR
ncbi:MAG: hypothetical protein FJ388_07365 [Verrucomicrobia bacterium]|nr:hypothetical protein [Verrucomicrobiota bacterium]